MLLQRNKRDFFVFICLGTLTSFLSGYIAIQSMPLRQVNDTNLHKFSLFSFEIDMSFLFYCRNIHSAFSSANWRNLVSSCGGSLSWNHYVSFSGCYYIYCCHNFDRSSGISGNCQRLKTIMVFFFFFLVDKKQFR